MLDHLLELSHRDSGALSGALVRMFVMIKINYDFNQKWSNAFGSSFSQVSDPGPSCPSCS